MKNNSYLSARMNSHAVAKADCANVRFGDGNELMRAGSLDDVDSLSNRAINCGISASQLELPGQSVMFLNTIAIMPSFRFSIKLI